MNNIDPARSALLIMDYQPGIVERMPDPEALVARAAATIATARAGGVTVGYVRVAFADGDLDDAPETSGMARNLRDRLDAMHADAPATQVHPALAPQDGDVVVRKTRVGAFSTTDLHEQLTDRGIDTIILAGLSTSGVTLSTVRNGYDRDYRVIVLDGVTADPDPEVHAFLMNKVFPRQAEVMTLAELGDGLES